ncbi:ankyrin repeat-containing domain protein [Trichoderma barbatum]
MSKKGFEFERNQEAASGPEKKRKGDSGDVWTPVDEPLMRKLGHDDYTVGWICAINVEYVAAQEFLDEEHEGPEDASPHDNNNYTLGRIGKHNVVIATLPLGEYGIASAATVARDMMRSFHNIRIGLMVGIGGGAPSESHDIRLGDIVVSAPKDGRGGLLQYDFGKNLQDESDLETTGFLNQPPVALRTALAGLRAQYERKGHQIEHAVNNVLEKNKRLQGRYKRPAPSSDRLYPPGVVHPNTKEGCILACDPSGLIPRPERTEDEDNLVIHYGLIASANQLMKNAILRDKLAAEKGVLCFEMEAAGLMNHFPCLVIRGICDYSDSHKNKEWQGYAAMVAAAYAKDLLYRIAPNSVTAEKRIRDILSDVQETVAGVGKDVHKLVHRQYSQEHQAILDWLTPVDYAPQHNDFFSRRQEGTGQWLLESVEFQTWLKTDGQTLFCPGIPGAGKTIITAIVINHLLDNVRDDPHIGIAYIYCNFRRHDEQTAEKLLTSLLKQLAQLQSSLPQIVKDLYEKHEKSRTRPSLVEITAALHSVAETFSRIFIVIDALDECQDLSRLRLLDEIFNLQNKTKANIFATSRIDDTIGRRFDGCSIMKISAADRDVLAYLNGQISLRRSEVINGDIKDKIRAGVLKAAGGMFLLATFHIDTIMSQPTRGEIKEALQKLGRGMEGLHEMYSQAMERIEGHTVAIRSLAKRILTWITHAKRPLSITEVQHALAVREHMAEFDPEYMPDAKDLKSVCAGLVTTDEGSGIIRLVHYTTQEFFQQTQEEWFPEGESYIAKICVTYLSFNAFGSGVCRMPWKLQERLQSYPLYDYAARNWGHHAQKAATIGREVKDFLDCRAKVEASSQLPMMAGDFNWPSTDMDNGRVSNKSTGLHLAAYFGVEKAVDYLLQKTDHPDLKDRHGRTPLSWASETGSVAVVEQLLSTRKVEADSKDMWNQTPLFHASANNHEDIVRLLLQEGVNANSNGYGSYSYRSSSPLLQAAENGYFTIAKLLLERGAVANSKSFDSRTPLSSATERGHGAVVQLLLENGAALEEKVNYGRTPLLLATEKGHAAVVQVLLNNNAAIEERDENGQTPLLLAAERGHAAVVQLLLGKGADANLKADSWGETPLHSAVRGGYTTIVQLLLDKGADANLKPDSWCDTPLLCAVRNGDEATVQLLLDKGADADLRADSWGDTPLLCAARNGDEAIVQLLLNKGADANLLRVDGSQQTPLSWAARNGDEAIVQLLLNRGADPDARSDYGQTPLIWAAESGQDAIVQLLLDRGADPNAKSHSGQTPLQMAAKNRHTAIVELLLDRGADLDAGDDFGQTPLLWAVRNKNEAIIQLLLNKGADDTLYLDYLSQVHTLKRGLDCT